MEFNYRYHRVKLMAGSPLLTKILSNFPFDIYLLNYVPKNATNHPPNVVIHAKKNESKIYLQQLKMGNLLLFLLLIKAQIFR